MSAIVGIYYRNGQSVSESLLDEAMKRLSHRGSDGNHVWREGSVGLGHVMLWTTPESLNERLPLVDPAGGGLVLVADARIDNRRELLKELYGLEAEAPDIADSQLILAGYKKWGNGCAERFIGDFAFAVWDSKTQKIFCARDHFGVKPFYYYLSDKVFVFATEIKALLSLPEVPQRLNEVRVADFLAGIDDNEITSYDQIFRLPPAHSLAVDAQGQRLESYWKLDPSSELRLSSNEEYAEAFREQFTEAVRCRVRSAFPVGSMLSGGLDSSSITCVARDLQAGNNQSLRTFSAIFDKVKESDERQFINIVLAQNGVKPNFVHGDELTPLENLKDVIWHQENFIASGNHFIQWGLCRAAAAQGVRVVLDGYDGDTTVSHGTGYLVELARTGRWIKLRKESRGYASHFDGLEPWELFWWYLQKYWLDPNLPNAVKPAWRKLRGAYARLRPAPDSARLGVFPQFLNGDFALRIGLEDRRRALKKVRSSGRLKSERQAHYSRLAWAGLTEAVESLNKLGGAFGVEYRFPFFDKRLVEFCLSLPGDQKLSGGWNRVVMRRAMEGILPREVQWRGGKGNMTANFERGLRAERALIDDVLITHAEPIERYVDLVAVRAAYERFLANQAGESDVMAIWRSVSLALWLRSLEIAT